MNEIGVIVPLILGIFVVVVVLLVLLTWLESTLTRGVASASEVSSRGVTGGLPHEAGHGSSGGVVRSGRRSTRDHRP